MLFAVYASLGLKGLVWIVLDCANLVHWNFCLTFYLNIIIINHKALRIGDFVINLNLPYNLVNQMIYNDFADLVKSCT